MHNVIDLLQVICGFMILGFFGAAENDAISFVTAIVLAVVFSFVIYGLQCVRWYLVARRARANMRRVHGRVGNRAA